MSGLSACGWTNDEGIPLFDLNNADNFDRIHEWWKPWILHETSQPYFAELCQNIAQSHKELEQIRGIFPPKPQVFKVFEYGPPSVVIIGQDPYPTAGNAMGLSFSVPRSQPRPPSLLTIYKELERDGQLAGKAIPTHGDLTSWAEQSVMLLNVALTVRESNAGSHLGVGWGKFTDHVIERINKECEPGVVFMLWGNFAQQYETNIDTEKHCILRAGHPSPLNRTKPFVGCGHFSKANAMLAQNGRVPIRWASITDPSTTPATTLDSVQVKK